MSILLVEREMTDSELVEMRSGFDLYSSDNSVEVQSFNRFGFVAVDDRERFVGCSSGLAYRNGDAYSGWFFLTDLYVDKNHRAQGVGAKLLKSLEASISSVGIKKIWTWTAEYEAQPFYFSQGYEQFAELEDWYSNGDSRVALRKTV